jgi:hypothetical protein
MTREFGEERDPEIQQLRQAASDPVKVGDLLADKELLPLTPENILQKLAPIVRLKSNGATEDSWTFSRDGVSESVPWAKAQFAARGKGNWAFGQLALVFKPVTEDVRVFFDTVTGRVRRKLGKPAETRGRPPGARSSVWNVTKDVRLAVEESVDPETGPLVELRLSVPEGDPD